MRVFDSVVRRWQAIAACSATALALVGAPASAQDPGGLVANLYGFGANGFDWEPGAEVAVTIDDDADRNNGVIDRADTTADATGYWDVTFVVQIEPGHVVTATTADASLTHVVVDLAVTGIDADADVVTGTGPAGEEVAVVATRNLDDFSPSEPPGHGAFTTVGADGAWTMDFAAQGQGFDLTRLHHIQLDYNDGSNGLTFLHHARALPTFRVEPETDNIDGGGWEPGTVLTVTIDDDTDDGNGVLHRLTDVQVDTDGAFRETGIGFDLAGGQHVTVDDGDVAKHLQVATLDATVDPDADTVSGTVDVRAYLAVTADPGAGGSQLDVDVQAGEAWALRFAEADPPWDITASTQVTIEVRDGNDDMTYVSIEGEEPAGGGGGETRFEVYPRADRLTGYHWAPGALARVSVDDDGDPGNGTVQEIAVTVADDGSLDTDLQLDVRGGHVVTVDDGTTRRSHTVWPLAVMSVNTTSEVVRGTTTPGTSVSVDAVDTADNTSTGRTVVADAEGVWVADLAGRVDLSDTVDVYARQSDDDGDATVVLIRAVNPVLSGETREDTAAAVSQATYADGQAQAVVLARRDHFADALAGTPLAVAVQAPLLLTETATLPERTEAELTRVLPTGRTVYLLGGTSAISDAVAARVEALGYLTQRVSGMSRFHTAVAAADLVDNPQAVLLTTGLDFPDGLAAGAAAPQVNGVVLLTEGDKPHPATAAWLAAHPGVDLYAVGGPATRAHPEATPVSGPSRHDTALAVARTFFDQPSLVGVARADDFPDALAGGVHAGWAGGPMVLTDRDVLTPSVESYLQTNAASIRTAFAYGGTAALSPDVLDAIIAAID